MKNTNNTIKQAEQTFYNVHLEYVTIGMSLEHGTYHLSMVTRCDDREDEYGTDYKSTQDLNEARRIWAGWVRKLKADGFVPFNNAKVAA